MFRLFFYNARYSFYQNTYYELTPSHIGSIFYHCFSFGFWRKIRSTNCPCCSFFALIFKIFNVKIYLPESRLIILWWETTFCFVCFAQGLKGFQSAVLHCSHTFSSTWSFPVWGGNCMCKAFNYFMQKTMLLFLLFQSATGKKIYSVFANKMTPNG